MASLLHKLRRLFVPHNRQESEQKTVDVLTKDFARLSSADPETNLQWLRLQRTLAKQPQEVRQAQTRLIPRFAFGFAVIAAAIVGAYFYFMPRELAPETYATRKGEQTRVVLQDSSEVTLNYATQLIVPKMESGKARLLSLIGEAFFKVRRNETPFIVSTEFVDVRVVGTEFNVRAREGMVEVAVIHGSVNVSNAKDGKMLVLTQGQRALCARAGAPQLIDNVPSIEYPGWMHGRLLFDKATFADACREIEMRFDVTIRIDDANVRNEIVMGMLNAKNAESAITALCGLTGKTFRHDGQEYEIY